MGSRDPEPRAGGPPGRRRDVSTRAAPLGSPPDLSALCDEGRLALVEGGGLRSRPPREPLERVCRLVRETLGCDAASVTAVGVAQTTVASDGLELPEHMVTVPLGESFCARAMASGYPLPIEDAATHPWVAETELARSGLVVAYLGIPLFSRNGHALGALCAFWDTPRAWSVEEMAVLSDLAGWAMAVLDLQLTEQELVQAMEAQADARSELPDAVLYDALTGLPNHAQLSACLDRWLARGHASVAVCSLAGLARVNDVFGRSVGDAMLKRVAGQLRRAMPATACVARLEGDQFAVALPDGDLSQARRVAADMIDIVVAPVGLAEDVVAGRASTGVASSTSLHVEDGEQPAAVLLRAARGALRAAEQRPGNAVEAHDGQRRAALERDRHLERVLRRAIYAVGHDVPLPDARLSLVFQPIYHLPTQRVIGVEALARFHCAELGTVSPGEFVPLAEQHGFMTELGDALLALVDEQRRRWHADGVDAGTLWVNLSQLQLDDPAILERLDRIARTPGSRLGVEVTETALFHGDDGVDHVVELRRRGVPVAIDDVGTGYASLSALDRLPCDALKIDRSFVDQVVSSPLKAAIVSAILTVGRSLDADVIAEGIETPEQLDALLELGCHYGSGYLLARPAPDGATLRAHLAAEDTR